MGAETVVMKADGEMNGWMAAWWTVGKKQGRWWSGGRRYEICFTSVLLQDANIRQKLIIMWLLFAHKDRKGLVKSFTLYYSFILFHFLVSYLYLFILQNFPLFYSSQFIIFILLLFTIFMLLILFHIMNFILYTYFNVL